MSFVSAAFKLALYWFSDIEMNKETHFRLSLHCWNYIRMQTDLEYFPQTDLECMCFIVAVKELFGVIHLFLVLSD